MDRFSDASQSSLGIFEAISDLSTSDQDENSVYSNDLISLEDQVSEEWPPPGRWLRIIEWNYDSICRSKKRSKSDSNISRSTEELVPKLFRQPSLSWKFKFAPTQEKIKNYDN
ncbi:Hypothetical protein CINCED_3A000413 [Cinara cedri]|uniref:Uncharacterized protein n=1 Tax=Cinara cedri TaxID=506608 RepID=A0A5E4MM08_9HEMI|nr:Hypothetical protein CINCED_3A000413 [Cinara cedri]